MSNNSKLNKEKTEFLKRLGLVQIRGWFNKEDAATVRALDQRGKHDKRRTRKQEDERKL